MKITSIHFESDKTTYIAECGCGNMIKSIDSPVIKCSKCGNKNIIRNLKFAKMLAGTLKR